MGRVKIRVTASPKDMTKFLTALHKAEESLRALSLVGESQDFNFRDSTDVRRYLEFDFDSEGIGEEELLIIDQCPILQQLLKFINVMFFAAGVVERDRFAKLYQGVPN
ncbi:hypothetical protein LC653_06010 [Nostoc sp. CHAB 5784]|uniref:hypothetical protein n=1 Tax=Nostoc mirabile TaxID=2907820 RepID=UPI001E350493|nr:hypothetical protein [Nostoc mirabile]MCC5663499.1 hypothetical protein [Nostoc mirabile CHAB5784]